MAKHRSLTAPPRGPRKERPDAQGLTSLHRILRALLGTRRSVLFAPDPSSGRLRAISGAGGWDRAGPLPEPEGEALRALLAPGDPVVAADLRAHYPALAALLDADRGILLPLASRKRRLGLVAAGGIGRPDAADAATLGALGRIFVAHLEAQDLRARFSRRHDLQELLHRFSRSVVSAVDLSAGLHSLCAGVARLFEARRVSVWIHDRRARVLVLDGRSTSEARATRVRVSVDEGEHPAARGLRLDRPAFLPATAAGLDERQLAVPLRGRRRALGTVVIEGLPTRLAAREVLDASGEFGRGLSSAIDNLQLLTEVLRSRRELENIFNSLVDLVVVCDHQLHVIHFNRAFGTRIGLESARFGTLPLSKFVSKETYALLARIGPAGSRRGGGVTRQVEDPLLGGTFVMTAAPLVGQHSQRLGWVLVARDITEQARLEAERAALRQQLAQAEKLAALGQFVAGIAHELNNPLQAVLGHIELVRATGRLSPSLQRDLQHVYREAERAGRIVRNLLVFAGSGRMARRRFSLHAALGRALRLRAAACRRAGITLARRLDPNVPKLLGDPLLFHQALLNIILNAEQAMAGGPGRLEISTKYDQHRGRVIARLRDTGPGLPSEVLPRIFEPFFTTKQVGEGTGLGLALTYRIIHEHGGTIRAENHPVNGAVFTLELPTDKVVKN